MKKRILTIILIDIGTIILSLFIISVIPSLFANFIVNSPNQGIIDITCSTIESYGTIIASIIGVVGLNGIAKTSFETYFTNFSSKSHHLEDLFKSATKEITIITFYGDNLLEQYTPLLKRCVRNGIQLNYLLLSKDYALQMPKYYFHDDDHIVRERITLALTRLNEIKHSSAANCHIKQWAFPLSASYIAIDAGISPHRSRWIRRSNSTALIQLMIYQYGIRTPNSPITYLTYNHNPDAFENTVQSLRQMWASGLDFNIDEYINSLAD